MARQCEASHCSAADPEINSICKSEGWPIGHPVLTRDSNGICQCQCSCFALNTPISIGKNQEKVIQDFVNGDEVLAAGIDLNWIKKKVKFSQGTKGNSKQPFTIYIEFGDEQYLIVTSDHLFLMPDGSLKRADKLTTEDNLVSPNGDSIHINGVEIGDFYGGFHHIATDTTKPDKNLDGHLIIANGVVSADYAVQLYYAHEEIDSSLLSKDSDDAPFVGSEEYRERYERPTNLKINKYAPSVFGVSDNSQPVFVPLEKSSIQRPKDALGFFSDAESKKITAAVSKRGFTDPFSQAWTEYLFTQFKAFYPNVTYLLDWSDDNVNAYAWVDKGVRYVEILGGMVRAQPIEIEGLALVIAHELGHHYGGAPTYPNGLSCEGQADYYGANNIMRVTWFGEYYVSMMEKAIVQLGNLLGHGSKNKEEIMKAAFLPETMEKVGAGCSHPPAACRIATYNAAVDLKAKPACAG